MIHNNTKPAMITVCTMLGAVAAMLLFYIATGIESDLYCAVMNIAFAVVLGSGVTLILHMKKSALFVVISSLLTSCLTAYFTINLTLYYEAIQNGHYDHSDIEMSDVMGAENFWPLLLGLMAVSMLVVISCIVLNIIMKGPKKKLLIVGAETILILVSEFLIGGKILTAFIIAVAFTLGVFFTSWLGRPHEKSVKIKLWIKLLLAAAIVFFLFFALSYNNGRLFSQELMMLFAVIAAIAGVVMVLANRIAGFHLLLFVNAFLLLTYILAAVTALIEPAEAMGMVPMAVLLVVSGLALSIVAAKLALPKD